MRVWKRLFSPQFSTSFRRLKWVWKKLGLRIRHQRKFEYLSERVATGPRETPSENTHITDKVIHGHKFTEYSSTKTQNTTDSEFACIFYRSNILKLANKWPLRWTITTANLIPSLVRSEQIPSSPVESNQVPISALILQHAPHQCRSSKEWSLAGPRLRWEDTIFAGLNCACRHI